jgi:C1A family cysteine protease
MLQLNVLPSPPDENDYEVCDFMVGVEVPVEFSWVERCLPIRNQGQQGSCFAMSVGAVKEVQESAKEYFSPQFFYNNRANLYDDNPKNDEGMYGRSGMALLKDIGICFEKTYPYGRIEQKSRIPANVYSEAGRFKIKSYARVRSTNELKQSLVEHGPAVVCVPVYNMGDRMWKQQPGDRRIGGHAMAIVGYDKIGFIIRNSWGAGWGNQGYTRMPFADFPLAWEVWTSVDDGEKDEQKDEKDHSCCCACCPFK